jgi:hypothetical protein
LVDSSSRLMNYDVSVLSVNVTLDIHNLSFLILDKVVLISKHLPPS